MRRDFVVRARCAGPVLEVNPRLAREPWLLQRAPAAGGYAAVVRGAAGLAGRQVLCIEGRPDKARKSHGSSWMLVGNNRALFENPKILAGKLGLGPSPPLVWTDDYSNL